MPPSKTPSCSPRRPDRPTRAQSPALAELISADELLLLEDGHCIRDQALAVCHAIDPRRLRSFGATSFSTLLQLVAAGHGVTLLPELAVDAGIVADARLAVVRFAAPEPSRTIGVAWRRSSPRERDFRALAGLVREAGQGDAGMMIGRLGLASWFATIAFAAAAQDVSGRYTVEGRNFDGSRYRGHGRDRRDLEEHLPHPLEHRLGLGRHLHAERHSLRRELRAAGASSAW